MDRAGVGQLPEGCGEQERMERAGSKVVSGGARESEEGRGREGDRGGEWRVGEGGERQVECLIDR